MTRYVALLRGIMPTNPNMRNEKLRDVFESLGFSNVRTLISSGNVLFESKTVDMIAQEKKIEKALFDQLGIKSPAFIRSEAELARLIKKDPFKGMAHGPKSYLIVSFLRKKPSELFNVLDLAKARTPEVMRDIEKEHGKEVTTRTWKTVQRIAAKMDS